MEGLNFMYSGKPEDNKVEMVNLNQEETCWKQMKLGKLYAKSARYDEALLCYNKAIEMESSELSFFFYRGVARFHINDLKGAFEDMKKAKTANPWNMIDILNYMACIHFRLGETKQAREMVAQVLNSNRGLLNDLVMSYDEYIELTSK